MKCLRTAFFVTTFLLQSVLLAADDEPALQKKTPARYEPFAVVELFTSEGCSSCPPADRLLRDLTALARKQGKRIFTLGFHVDYWNLLGWEDRFSDIQYTLRQRHYSTVFKNGRIYTPQMIINGHYEFGGYRADLAHRYIEKALTSPGRSGIRLEIRQKDRLINVRYTLQGTTPEDKINIALVENGLNTQVEKGENAGKHLEHANVVRIFRTYSIRGKTGAAVLEAPPDVNLQQASIIAYVQNIHTFEISQAAGIRLEAAGQARE